MSKVAYTDRFNLIKYSDIKFPLFLNDFSRNMDIIDETFGSYGQRLARVENVIDTVSTQNIEDLQSRLGALENKVVTNTTNIHELNDNLSSTNNNVTTNTNNISALGVRASSLEGRVTTLEDCCTAVNDRLNATELATSKNADDITDLQNRLTYDEANIQGNADDIVILSTQVATNAHNIDELTHALDDLDPSSQYEVVRQVSENTQSISELQSLTNTHTQRLDGYATRFTEDEIRITDLERRMTSAETALENVGDWQDQIDSLTATVENVSEVEVPALTTLVNGYDSRITAIETWKTNTVDSFITSTNTALSTHDSRISALESADTALSGRVSSAEGNITTLQTGHATNVASITALDGRVDAIEDAIGDTDISTWGSSITGAIAEAFSRIGSATSNDVMHSTMPVASADNLGKTIIYTGASNTTGLVKGAQYECKAVAGSNPTTYEWVRADNDNYVTPEMFGAVADGNNEHPTQNIQSFRNYDMNYYLGADKVYGISGNQYGIFPRMHDSAYAGKGIVKVTMDNTYPDAPDNFGQTYYEFSQRQPLNTLQENVEWFAKIKNYATEVQHRLFKQQSRKHLPNASGHYHSIGAVYYAHDLIDSLPNQFTLCIGRGAVFQRKGSGEWVKTVDMQVQAEHSGWMFNYKLPWMATQGHEKARAFTHTPTMVDGHYEIVINKEELTAWQGDVDPESPAVEACAHWWSDDYYYNAGEYDDLVNYWEVWVKEPDAAGKFILVTGVDTSPVGGVSNPYQEIVAASRALNTEPHGYWNCTMNIYDARELIFEELATQLFETKYPIDAISSGGRNLNELGLNNFSLDAPHVTLSYDGDLFTLTLGEHPSITSAMVDLTPYLKAMPNIKAGDKFRLNIECMNGNFTNQGNFYYADHKVLAMSTGYERKGNYIISKVFTAEVDWTWLKYNTSSSVNAPKFRVWVTKGEEYVPYQVYGADVSGWVLEPTVKVPYLESKIEDLIPSGVIIPYGGTTAPTGWLLCNGSAVSRTDYAKLFGVIGTAYGTGDGSTTFNIPDMRECVPKGAGLSGKAVNYHLDANGLAVGEFLDDQLADHTHDVYVNDGYTTSASGHGTAFAESGSGEAYTEGLTTGFGNNTTEVKSIGVNYIIKV